MAQKTIVQLIDDLDGGEADESVSFTLDGIEYTIDLSASNAARLRNDLAVYAEAGRRIGGRKVPGRPAPGRARTVTRVELGIGRGREDNNAIRAWSAQVLSRPVSARGRIPRDVMAAYDEAHKR